MKFEIKKSKKTGQFYWRIVANNGKKLCHSEQYRRRVDALNAVKIIKDNAAKAEIV